MFSGYNPAYLDRRMVERPIDKTHRFVAKNQDTPAPNTIPKQEEMFDVHALDCWICPGRPERDEPEYESDVQKSMDAKPVIKCDMNGNPLWRYDSVVEAAIDNDIKRPEAIYRVLRNERNHTAGFKWKFA